jgi:eukaryotic-like serine/threonine-protein kinase
MSLICPRCSRSLEFSGDRPMFCAYCGQALSGSTPADSSASTVTPSPGSATTAQNRHDDSTVAFVATRSKRVVAAPERVAGYRLLRPLGSGGMGTVYEAEDSQFGRRVALKLIAPGHLESADAVERFRQEGRLASTIAHPRCVFVLAADEEAGRPYIVMELMPGTTLQSLVDERGPLPPDEAVAKILDVVEGLEEAHQLGVIHRDVKPSNCFLDVDGRVKIGDFGLSKSVSGNSHLTRTGAFIGTPLYSSPEQIRGDGIDKRTDVYSVSATLYFLLAGKPPHQASDAAGTLAKIVADPVKPLRSINPLMPAALDRAVLRGLERQRERRWQSLEDMRAALLPFAPGRMSIGSVGLRTAAFLIDTFILKTVIITLIQAGLFIIRRRPEMALGWSVGVSLVIDIVLWSVVFGVGETLLGHSPGKWLLRLQVRRAEGVGDADWRRIVGRTAFVYLLMGLPSELLAVAELLTGNPWLVFPPLLLGLRLAGALALGSTMRASNGFRGLQDIISGTCVVRLAERPERRAPRIRREIRPFRNPMKRPIGVLETVGPFRVGGAVRWEPDRRVLLGEDVGLKRQVWIVMRTKGSPPPPSSRRDIGRPTRTRWLRGGDEAAGRWDAYVAPTGCPLVDLAGIDGMPWSDVRPILQDLTAEMAAACDEGTLPDRLSIEQVWVEPDGRVLLVDSLAPVGAQPDGEPAARALRLLRQTASVALEGGRRRVDDTETPVRAVAPRHAVAFLDRLWRGKDVFVDPKAAALGLKDLADRPTDVNRVARLVRILVMAVLCSLGLGAMFLFPLSESFAVDQFERDHPGESLLGLHRAFAWMATAAVCVPPLAWAIWSFAARGGFSLDWLRMSLVGGNGRPAARWRCAWRTFACWAPAAAFLELGVWSQVDGPGRIWVLWTFWGLAVAWLAADVIVALCSPTRSLHDRLSGTYLVPA